MPKLKGSKSNLTPNSLIQLLNSESFAYKSIFLNLPEMCLLLDSNDDTIIECSQKVYEVTGYSHSERIGKSVHNFYHNSAQNNLDRTAKSESSINNDEIKVIKKDNSLLNIALNKSFFKNKSGKIIASIVIWKDFCNKKLTEIELKKYRENLIKSEERYTLASKATEYGIWDWNILTDEVFYSAEWKKQIGYNEDEIKNDFGSWIKHLHPEESEYMQQKVKEFVEHGEGNFELDFRFRHKDGHYIYIHSKAAVVKDENGKITRLFGAHTDITKLKKAQIELETHWKQFESILNAFPEILLVIDLQKSEIVFVNKYTADLIGFNPIGLKFHKKFYGFQIPTIKSMDDLKNEIINEMTFEYKNEKLNRYFQITNKLIKWTDGRDLLFKIAIDISKQKDYEVELESSLKEVRKSNKELEQFAYVISHDLQEPLRMVHSFTQLLEKKYYDLIDATGKQYIYYASDGALRMHELINDLLKFSRISTTEDEFEVFSLSDALNLAIENLRIKIEENGAVIYSDEMPNIFGDKNQIIRVFQNLLENSLKYRSRFNPIITVSFMQISGDKIKITLEDNGIGFNNIYSERIFTIFQRLHRRDEYSGTGIGLSICKKIIERHGGEIWADSVEGKGTKIHFTLKFYEE
ncbi:MAG: PAS domain-containing protein [Ignavibacteriae bacterium]|nr:PAS domain-containing protein [Ignavibacteriota bacterium]